MASLTHIRSTVIALTLSAAFMVSTSCTSTKVIASNYDDTFSGNEYYETDDWSYLWGMVRKDVYVGKDGDDSKYGLCDEGSLANVEVKTTFGGALLTIVTVGIVNHRKVKYGCSRPSNGDGGLDD